MKEERKEIKKERRKELKKEGMMERSKDRIDSLHKLMHNRREKETLDSSSMLTRKV